MPDDPREELKVELRAYLDAAATKLGAVTDALDASVLQAKLASATQDVREAVLLVDGLAAMRRQVPGLDKADRALRMSQDYSDFRKSMGDARARILAAVDVIDNPPGPEGMATAVSASRRESGRLGKVRELLGKKIW